jgi:hypothetical protein
VPQLRGEIVPTGRVAPGDDLVDEPLIAGDIGEVPAAPQDQVLLQSVLGA